MILYIQVNRIHDVQLGIDGSACFSGLYPPWASIIGRPSRWDMIRTSLFIPENMAELFRLMNYCNLPRCLQTVKDRQWR